MKVEQQDTSWISVRRLFREEYILKKNYDKHSGIRRGHSQLNKHVWFLYIKHVYTIFLDTCCTDPLFRARGN